MEDNEKARAELKDRLEKSTSYNSGLLVSFLMLMVYMLLIIASTTDRQLLIPDSKLTLPIFSVGLPLTSFFFWAPLIILVIHLNFLFNLRQHSRKLVKWYTTRYIKDQQSGEDLPSALPAPFLLNFIIHDQSKQRRVTFYKFIFWIIIYMLPVLILLLMEIKYSAYHDLSMTIWHSIILVLDIMLASFFWKGITDIDFINLRITCRDEYRQGFPFPGDASEDTMRARMRTLRLRVKWCLACCSYVTKCWMKRVGPVHSFTIGMALLVQVGFNAALWMSLSVAGEVSYYSPRLTQYISMVTPHLELREQSLVASSPGDRVMEWYLTAEKEKSKQQAEKSSVRFTISDEAIDILAHLKFSESFLNKVRQIRQEEHESEDKLISRIYSKLARINPRELDDIINGILESRGKNYDGDMTIVIEYKDVESYGNQHLEFPYPYLHCMYTLAWSRYYYTREDIENEFKSELWSEISTILSEMHWSQRTFRIADQDLLDLEAARTAPKPILEQLKKLRNKKFVGACTFLQEVERQLKDTEKASPRELERLRYVLFKRIADKDLHGVRRPGRSAQEPGGAQPAGEPAGEIAPRAKENAWKDFGEGVNLQGRDLRYADFKNANLRKADLRGARLDGANLEGAMLQWANLTQAHLEGANLRLATLRGATLTEAHLAGATLEQAVLESATLAGTKLQGSDLNLANLNNAQLIGANLDGAILWRAKLAGAGIDEASLRGADLEEANIQWATLRKSRMQGGCLRQAQLEGAKLDETQLTSAQLERATLRDAQLKKANLRSVILDNASLEDANLSGVELQSALIVGASLLGAEVSGAHLLGISLTEQQVGEILDFNTEKARNAGASVEASVSAERTGENGDRYRKYLEERKQLACEDKHVARGIWRQLLFEKSEEEARKSIAQHMEAKCPALWREIGR